MATILFPRKGDRLRAHSVFFQALRVAGAGIGVTSGMVPSRASATSISVSSGAWRNVLAPGTYAGGSLTTIPAAASGKHRYDLVVFDVSDSTLKRIAGSEDTPTSVSDFLENLQPIPPELSSSQQILLGVFIVDQNGVQNSNHGHYCTAGVANMVIELPVPHEQNKDQYLDYGGPKQTSATEARDAADKKHTQNTDTALDQGGANPITAAQAKAAFDAKHTAGTDQYLDSAGSNKVSAADLKIAQIHFPKGDGSDVVATGQFPDPYDAQSTWTITGWKIIESSGNATTASFNIWKKNGSLPSSGDSIGNVSISGAVIATGTPSGSSWSTDQISSGDYLLVNLASNSAGKALTLVLYLSRRY